MEVGICGGMLGRYCWWDLSLIGGGEESLMGGEMMVEGIDGLGEGIEGDGKEGIKGDKNYYEICTVLFFRCSLPKAMSISRSRILRRKKAGETEVEKLPSVKVL